MAYLKFLLLSVVLFGAVPAAKAVVCGQGCNTPDDCPTNGCSVCMLQLGRKRDTQYTGICVLPPAPQCGDMCESNDDCPESGCTACVGQAPTQGTAAQRICQQPTCNQQCHQDSDCNPSGECRVCAFNPLQGHLTCQPTGSVRDDPHFVGFNGKQFEFVGEPHKIFALISEPQLELLSEFAPWNPLKNRAFNGTVMSSLALSHCDDKLVMYGNRTILMNGNAILADTSAEFDSMDIATFTGPSGVTVKVSVGERWTFEFQMVGWMNIVRSVPHFDRSQEIRGVLGYGWNNSTHVESSDCLAKTKSGECTVPGKISDYTTNRSTGVAHAVWKHSIFNASSC